MSLKEMLLWKWDLFCAAVFYTLESTNELKRSTIASPPSCKHLLGCLIGLVLDLSTGAIIETPFRKRSPSVIMLAQSRLCQHFTDKLLFSIKHAVWELVLAY